VAGAADCWAVVALVALIRHPLMPVYREILNNGYFAANPQQCRGAAVAA
jgi:hypothetical protein